MYFHDFAPAQFEESEFILSLNSKDPCPRDYIASVLLDFCVIEPDLDDLPVATSMVKSQTVS